MVYGKGVNSAEILSRLGLEGEEAKVGESLVCVCQWTSCVTRPRRRALGKTTNTHVRAQRSCRALHP